MPDGATKSAAAPGAFAERYKIDSAARLPDFDTAGGAAYATADGQNPTKPCYAVVQHPNVRVRSEVFATVKSAAIANLVTPVDRGIQMLDGQLRHVTIFHRPTGGVLLDKAGKAHDKLNSTRLRQSVVLSCLKALAYLHKKNISHRHINPNRMFFISPDSDEIAIGEMITTPPGYMAPVGLEPLEVAFADPAARGDAPTSADFYQLGAALQALYHQTITWASRDRDSMLMARVNQGSYYALGAGQEIPGSLGTLIKGLMADSTDERWSSEEILDWYEGLQKPKRTSMKAWSMSRPTSFQGVAYVDRRLLADAFAQHPAEAARFLRGIEFSSWAQMALSEEVLDERTEMKLSVAPAEGKTSGSAADDQRLVSRVCMFLHSDGPVRFKTISLRLSGMAQMLAVALHENDADTLKALRDICDYRFLIMLRDVVLSKNRGFSDELRRIKQPISYAESSEIGKGLERVLYELEPTMPCISPKLSGLWVGSMKQMLRAFEALADQHNIGQILMDRHVAAYCARHAPKLQQPLTRLVAAQRDPARFAILVADFLGQMQTKYDMQKLPKLTNKLIESLSPVIKGLRKKDRREKVKEALEKVRNTGDISKLTVDINLEKIQFEDAREFGNARTTLSRLDRERANLTKGISAKDPSILHRGYARARTASFLILISVAFLVLT